MKIARRFSRSPDRITRVQSHEEAAVSTAIPLDPRPVAAWGTVGILIVLYIVALADRQILSLMVTPLRRDLGLSEVQIGLLQGFAFVLLFSTAAIPIGWAIDRFSRRIVIFLGVLVWSFSCAAAGFASSFLGLFWSRVGVGIGEAVILPGAYSMLSDMFPRRRSSLVLGIFSMSSNLGLLVSLTLGGLVIGRLEQAGSVTVLFLGTLAPWQVAFILVGAPGILLSALMFAVPEPLRRTKGEASARFLAPLVAFVRENLRTCGSLVLGFSFVTLLGYSMLAWTPVYFERRFGWTTGEIGLTLGIVMGVSGAIGPLASGVLGDWLFRRGVHDINFRAAIGAYCAIIPFGIATYIVPTAGLSLVCLAVTYFLAASCIPQAAASLQLVAGTALRGRFSAAYFLVASIVGQGLGPLLVAALTEHGLGDAGKIGISLAIVIPCAAAAGAIILLFGLTSFRARVEVQNGLEMGLSGNG